MPLRVLQLCAVDFTVKNFLWPLIYFLEDEGFEVTTACCPGPHFEEMKSEGLRMHPIRIKRSYDVLSHWLAIRKLTDYLKRYPFDIIHVHTPIAALIGRIAATRAKVPIRIYTAHGFYFHDRMNPLLRAAHITLERYGGKRCDYIFTQSDEDRQTAIDKKIIPANRIRTIGNGVDFKRFSPESVSEEEQAKLRAEFNIEPEDRVVAVIGRLVPEKGYHELFDAILGMRISGTKVKLLVVGDALGSDRGGGKSVFAKQINDLGETVAFAGLREDIPALLSLAEVYTLPSHREGMPRSIIEAMGMELPVVATDIRGSREEVVEGETGLLVPVGDHRALADAIGGLIANPQRARQMGLAGRQRAEEHFSEEFVLQRQLETYRRLIAEKGLSGR